MDWIIIIPVLGIGVFVYGLIYYKRRQELRDLLGINGIELLLESVEDEGSFNKLRYEKGPLGIVITKIYN